MRGKDDRIDRLESAVRSRFGLGEFVATGEGLASNHVVYRHSSNSAVEVSVVAIEAKEDVFSVQVEANFGAPDFAIPYAEDDLSLASVLAVLERYARSGQ